MAGKRSRSLATALCGGALRERLRSVDFLGQLLHCLFHAGIGPQFGIAFAALLSRSGSLPTECRAWADGKDVFGLDARCDPADEGIGNRSQLDRPSYSKLSLRPQGR